MVKCLIPSLPPRFGGSTKYLLILSFTLTMSFGCTASSPDNSPRPNAQNPSPTESVSPEKSKPIPGSYVVQDMQSGHYGGRLIIASAGDPKTFNPMLSNESSSDMVLRPMFSPCWGYNNGRQTEEPGLCERFIRSEDGLTYTFILREGIKWSDGQPITSADFAFSYGILTQSEISSADRDIFNQGNDENGNPLFPRLTVIDDRRFQFTLHRPDVLFHYTAGTFAVVPEHRWRQSFAKGQFNRAMSTEMNLADMVGSGPFVVTKYQPGERVVLSRNMHYWKVDVAGKQLPYLDELEVRLVADHSAALQRFIAGETHLLEVRASDYERLKRQEATSDFVVIDVGPSFDTAYFMFNLDDRSDSDGNPYVSPEKQRWFSNKNFRKAISHAIDRQSLVRNVLAGRGEPLWSYISPANVKWYPKNVEKYPYDLNIAARLLAQEGFVKRDGQLFDADGVPVEFRMMTNAESDTRIKILNYLREDFSRLGIKALIQPTAFNEVVTALRDTRKFEAVLLGWGTSIPPDPAFSKNVLFSGGTSHGWYPEQAKPVTAWEAKMDKLLGQSTATGDYQTRKRALDQLFEIFSDFQPQIQLVVTRDAAAARRNVGNFRPSALRPSAHWNVESLYLRTGSD